MSVVVNGRVCAVAIALLLYCHCTVVGVVFEVALHIPNSYNLSMNLPIVVGTVPYRRVPFLATPMTRHVSAGCHGMQYLPVVVPPPYRENPTPPPPVDGRLLPFALQ